MRKCFRNTTTIFFVLSIFLSGTAFASGKKDASRLSKAFHGFWNAKTITARHKAAKKIIELESDIGVLTKHLQSGQSYDTKVKTGRIIRTRTGLGGAKHHFAVVVPKGYDPTKRYPVHFFLHGGAASPPRPANGSWWPGMEAMEEPDRIAVFPAASNQALWWQECQIENVNGILDHVKRLYNIDENRAFLFGFSDGGTGVYYQALRHPTPWAAFFPLMTNPMVLANDSNRVEGTLFPVNFLNSFFYVVCGGRDHLYPAAGVGPVIDLFRTCGAQFEFIEYKDAGHDLSWTAEGDANLERFLEQHPRNPYPEKIFWETDKSLEYNRMGWVVITSLGEAEGEGQIFDCNRLNSEKTLFPRTEATGRILVAQNANTIEVVTQGVLSYKILISQAQFDLDQPIEVITNNRTSFRGVVPPDPQVLMDWAAKDIDRTMLFAAELDIDVNTSVDSAEVN